MIVQAPDNTSTGDHIPLFDAALGWIASGHQVALATVIQTWGSAPRPVGSHLVVRQDGLFEGSVSGGCVEGAVITEALACLAQARSTEVRFGVADAQAWEVGLACGGNITILIQPISDGFFPADLVRAIVSETDAGKIICVELDVKSGAALQGDQANAKPDSVQITYVPRARLAIVGAVHITQHLAPMATRLGYDVLIIDPRQMFAAAERMAGLSISDAWPDDALASWKPNAASAVVTLTHDPKLDDPALITALKSDAFYIAALGSRKTHGSRVERLKAIGFSEHDIARIHGPAGLAIGSRSPAEIAVSVLAEMTAVRRQSNG